jgi:phage/plasmid primase-like uncharacterized protein
MILPHLIEQARAVRLDVLAAERGFSLIRIRHGRELVGPCPSCGGTDRFSINTVKQVWNCRGCRVGGDVIALVQHLDGVEFSEAVARLVGGVMPSARAKRFSERRHDRNDADNRDRALEIWRQARDPTGTPVEAYLKRRGLPLPSPEVIRWHQACPFGGRIVPAMVALVRNIVTNEPQAIHRTALNLDGSKAEIICADGEAKDRMMLGSLKGGAVKLTDDAEVTTALGVGEGIETTLSLQRLPAWFGSPAWALLWAPGLASFPVLAGIESLMVAVDHDKLKNRKRAGEAAAIEVTKRWQAAGREVLLAWPTVEGTDLNDVVRGPS